MAYLLDTNVLVRLANLDDASHAVAARSIIGLHRRGEALCIAPQNLIEFRGVATRPAAANGLGLGVAEAESQATSFESAFLLMPETPDLFPAWKALVGSRAVTGKQVHDARLVAACNVRGVSHLLTFDGSHFGRLSSYGPGVVIVDPASV